MRIIRKKIESVFYKGDTLCEILAITSGNYVFNNFSWIDAGSLIQAIGIHSVNTMNIVDKESYEQNPQILKSQTNNFLKNRNILHKNISVSVNNAFDIAVSRCAQSFNIQPFLKEVNNCCIDMRVALESLFLLGSRFSKGKGFQSFSSLFVSI